MCHLERRHDGRPQLGWRLLSELNDSDVESSLHRRSAWVECLEDLPEAPLGSRRPADQKWSSTVGELSVKDQPGKTSEVISVQV